MTTSCRNKIKNNIKCGFYGCVVLIEDDYQRFFAGKIALDKNSIKMLQHEYSILNMLKGSEYIIKVIELCDFISDINFKLSNGRNLETGEEYKMMVMEYIQGSNDLSDILNSSINFIDAYYKSVIIQIIKAVNFCHQTGVFCLDLNLSNILYYIENSEIKIKLIDFGTVITDEKQKDNCIQQDYRSILKLFILLIIKKHKKEILFEDYSSLIQESDFKDFIKKINRDDVFSVTEKSFINYMVDSSNTITIKDILNHDVFKSNIELSKASFHEFYKKDINELYKNILRHVKSK